LLIQWIAAMPACRFSPDTTLANLLSIWHPTPMARVLVLFAHPALQKSRVNRAFADAVQRLERVTFHDLYEVYPEMHLNVDREQQLLLAHDVIVFQHPMYWYSTPAILKEWQDLVLEWGFAYGDGGTALRGKKFLSAISTGGPDEAYRRDGFNRFTIRELLVPIEQTARLCGMEYLPPFVLHAVLSMSPAQIASAATEYAAILRSIADEAVDYTAMRDWRYLNDGPLPLLAGKGAAA
jgi:glutathione-regulated potassium-efflux system ancillary protein KefG